MWFHHHHHHFYEQMSSQPQGTDYLSLIITTLGVIVGAIVGGVVAGKYSIAATEKLLNEERNLRKSERDESVRALLCGIYHEIDSVWTLYMSGAGRALESLADPTNGFISTVPTMSNYFPIYTGNVSKLGLVPDILLRKAITQSYTFALALMDALRLNNELLEEADEGYEEHRLASASSPSPTQTELAANRIRKLREFGPLLKRSHNEARDSVNALLPLLRPYT